MLGNAAFTYSLIEQMKSAGINVVSAENEVECFAVFDRSLVWHGGMNLLGKEDACKRWLNHNDNGDAKC